MIDTIVGMVITIATIGFGLYETYVKNAASHKTTQGKVDSVIATTVKHESELEKLVSDVETLKAELTKTK